MAIESVVPQVTTSAVEFGFIPAAEDSLFEVRDGVPIEYAISEASCLEESVMSLMTEAIGHGGMSVEGLHLCRLALDAAKALRMTAGHEGCGP